MTDILLIAGPDGRDAELVAAAAAYAPRNVTIVVDGDDPQWSTNPSAVAEARRDRLATLLTQTALATGAGVVGFVGDPSRLQAARGFDAIVGERTLLTAA